MFSSFIIFPVIRRVFCIRQLNLWTLPDRRTWQFTKNEWASTWNQRYFISRVSFYQSKNKKNSKKILILDFNFLYSVFSAFSDSKNLEKEKDCTTRKHLTVYFPKQLIRTQAVCSQVRVNAASRPGILCLNLIIRSWKLESLLFSRVIWNSCHQRKKPSQLVAPFYSFDKQKQKNLFLFWIHVSFHSKRSFFSSPKNKHKQNTAIKFHYYAYEDEPILTKDKNTVVFSSSWTFHSFFMFSQSICKSK